MGPSAARRIFAQSYDAEDDAPVPLCMQRFRFNHKKVKVPFRQSLTST